MDNQSQNAWWAREDQDLNQMKATVPYEIKQRKQGRWRKLVTTMCIVLTVGIVALTANIVITNKDITKIEDQGNQTLASTNAILARCGNLFTFYNRTPEALAQIGTFNPEELAQIDGRFYVPIMKTVLVPPFGYMTEQGLDQNVKFYHPAEDIPLSRTMRSVYDGTIILWYSPLASERDVQDIKEWVEQQDQVVAIPWKNANIGAPIDVSPVIMPMNRSIAFTSWGLTQSCGEWSQKATTDFINFASALDKDQPRSEIPPVADLDSNELLPSFVEP